MGLIVTNRQLQQQLNRIEQKVDLMSSTQDEINQEAQAIEADVAAENTATQAIKDAIAALEAQIAQGQAPDLTALKQAVTDLDSATASEQSAVPPSPSEA